MKLEYVYLIMQESVDDVWPVEAYMYERVAEARLKELQNGVNNRYESFFIQEIALDKKSIGI